MPTKTLLVDADILLYTAALRHEDAIEWLPGFFTWQVNLEPAIDTAYRLLDVALESVGADQYMLALTDITRNWRRDVLPTYKMNRKGGRKPLALLPLRDTLVRENGALIVPTLEGDDILGVWASGGFKENSVVWSLDKDLKTIPCQYLREVPSAGEEPVIMSISEPEANWWHLFQTLTGDPTDGYTGCPGIGPKRAMGLLPGDGKIPTEAIPEVWTNAVVPAYKRAHLTEEDALVQARVSRILRKGEYCKTTKRVKLWTPDNSHL